ncbi:hypothetical protein [Nitrosomonas nitrosa]|uniref:hypothetical protein n=1 Tax=Nitrosomonas nitrosa TaxID=52442 RepID=UPI001955FD5F|nr:hypothetical protein [Nitrosomonas nitrosa]
MNSIREAFAEYRFLYLRSVFLPNIPMCAGFMHAAHVIGKNDVINLHLQSLASRMITIAQMKYSRHCYGWLANNPNFTDFWLTILSRMV